mgnify:CR=1 FL=1
MALEAPSRPFTDRGDAKMGEFGQADRIALDGLHKEVDPIRTGQDQPLILSQIGERLLDLWTVNGLKLEAGKAYDFYSVSTERLGQLIKLARVGW